MAMLGIGRFILKEEEKNNRGMTVAQLHRKLCHSDQLKQDVQKEADKVLLENETSHYHDRTELSEDISVITKLNS